MSYVVKIAVYAVFASIAFRATFYFVKEMIYYKNNGWNFSTNMPGRPFIGPEIGSKESGNRARIFVAYPLFILVNVWFLMVGITQIVAWWGLAAK